MCYICMFMHSETDRISCGLRSKPNKTRDCITDTPKKAHACHAYNYNTYNVPFIQYNIRAIYRHIMYVYIYNYIYVYTHIILYYLIIYITYIHILCICIRGLFYIYTYHVMLVAYICVFVSMEFWTAIQPSFSQHVPLNRMPPWRRCCSFSLPMHRSCSRETRPGGSKGVRSVATVAIEMGC